VIERQVAMQEQLAEAALRLALAIEQGATQAVAEGRPVDKDAAMAFSRVARTVRMAGLLQAKLIKDLEQVQHRAEEDQLRHAKGVLAAYGKGGDAEAEDPALMEPADRHKYRVERIVARIAKAEHDDDEEEVERLVAEAAERLDDEDIFEDVLARPIGELVSVLCRDLDLEPDWKRLSGEAWAREEIASGAAGSPFLPPPPKVAGGGVSPVIAEGDHANAEEPAVEGAGGYRPPFDRPPDRPLAWSG
jgi:hypothetical protein